MLMFIGIYIIIESLIEAALDHFAEAYWEYEYRRAVAGF